ncbi:hypothetical protein, partial [Bacillus cereus group sp. BC243]|uniref:hypothetical protein n=1 Tax=Bacillus cereus group sp. BC243 TaxID=3445332 RepID=UPI003F696A16
AIAFDADTIDQLRATDYTVSFEGGAPSVIRKDSGATVDIGSGWDAANSTLTFGGISISFSNVPANGDQFEIQPVRRAANGMEVNINDLDKIA